MRSRALVLLPLLLFAALPPGASSSIAADLEAALAFVASRQGPDGRWALPAQGYVAEAAASAGLDPQTWPSARASAFHVLKPETCSWRAITDQQDCIYKSLLRAVHAAGASGYDPRAMNGLDGVAQVREGFVGGQFGQPVYINDDVWAVLALRAAGVPADDPMVAAAASNILAARAPDGGWSDRALASQGNVDMTGMALAALKAAGRDVHGDEAALAFVLRHAHEGGFRSMSNAGATCQSTAWGIHALDILGARTNDSALAWLQARQRPDGGFAISGSGPSDLFCTTEAIVVLAGARYPLPSFQPLSTPRPLGHALEDLPLPLPTGARHAVWRFEDATFEGRAPSRAFPTAGVYPYRLLVEWDGMRGRTQGEAHVLSARPVLGALPEALTLHRRVALSLDLTNATDPDGEIARIEIDWGDGNSTTGAQRRVVHAYEFPGDYTVRARAVDDAGVGSHPSAILVRVENRPPILPPLPARLVADRVEGVSLPLVAEDPDGDAVTVSWRFGELAGDGTPRFLPSRAGNGTLEIVLLDAFGGSTSAVVEVEVVNLPPRIVAHAPSAFGDEVELRASASDPDGPPPVVRWHIGGEVHDGEVVRVRAPRESLAARAVATDADGAEASAMSLLAPTEGPREAPEVLQLEARLEGDELVVAFFSSDGATVTLAWTSDAGAGEMPAQSSPARVPLPGATWALARIVAERDGLSASRESGLLLAPVAPAEPPAPARTPPAVEVVAQAPAAPPVDAPTAATRLAPVDVSLQSREERETPAPPLALLLLALLAPCAALRRRAP